MRKSARQQPLITMWNMYKRVNDNLLHTNNASEAFIIIRKCASSIYVASFAGYCKKSNHLLKWPVTRQLQNVADIKEVPALLVLCTEF